MQYKQNSKAIPNQTTAYKYYIRYITNCKHKAPHLWLGKGFKSGRIAGIAVAATPEPELAPPPLTSILDLSGAGEDLCGDLRLIFGDLDLDLGEAPPPSTLIVSR